MFSKPIKTHMLPKILLDAMMRENIEIEEVKQILATIENLNIDQLFADGRTPLVVACQRGNLPLVKLLVETYGARVNQVVIWEIKEGKNEYTTPLDSAISDCPDALQIVWYLLDKNANINDDVFLNKATIVGNEKIVEALLVWGANVKTSHAVYLAAARNNHALIFLLAEWGADINKSNGNCSPLEIATGKNHMEAVNVLLELGAKRDSDNPSDRYVMEKDKGDRYVMEKDKVCSLRFFAANVVHRELEKLEKAFREESKQRVLSYIRP
jgi:ankyrin repeat protein